MLAIDFTKGLVFGIEYMNPAPEENLPFLVVLHLGFIRVMFVS